jgi:hypothetical protein
MSISVNTKGDISFSIQGEVSYPTPLGTFAVGVILDPASHFGVANTLTVRVDGNQDTIYDLHGEDFDIVFNSGYYKQISLYKKGSNLFLEIARAETPNMIVPTVVEPTQTLQKQPTPGIYQVNRFLITGDWILTLTTIDVLNNEQVKVNLVWRNNGTSTDNMGCNSNNDDATDYLMLTTGIRIFPIETYCTSRRGEDLDFAPGTGRDSWAIYPALDDATQPFSLVWGSNGTFDNIILSELSSQNP